MIVGSAILLAELVALFFGVTFAVYLIQRRLGSERLRAWMGGSPVVSAVKGIAIGFVTPFCTYSAIPMLIGLRQAGVPPAGYVAFITAAPVLDPVMLGALVLIVGPGAAALYVAVAFSAAMGLALLAQRSNIESMLKPMPVGTSPLSGSATESALSLRGRHSRRPPDAVAAGTADGPTRIEPGDAETQACIQMPAGRAEAVAEPGDAVTSTYSQKIAGGPSELALDGLPEGSGQAGGDSACSIPGGGGGLSSRDTVLADDSILNGDKACAASACDDETPWRGLRVESLWALRSAVTLLRSIAWILLAGLAVGMAIETAVSPEDVASITGDNGAFAIPIAAALGTPLYIETSLFIPIADALASAGVGVGAIVALTISGAGANIPEFVILTKLAQRRLIVVFIGYVFAVAMVGGTLAHVLLA